MPVMRIKRTKNVSDETVAKAEKAMLEAKVDALKTLLGTFTHASKEFQAELNTILQEPKKAKK